MPKYQIVDSANTRQEVEITLADYQAAADAGLSLSEHLARTYPVNVEHGSVLEQAMASSGMFLRHDPGTGLRPPTMKEVFNGTAGINVAAVRGDGSERHEPAGRLLYPEIVMQAIQSELTESFGDFLNGFNSMIALTATVTGPTFDQPVIDVQAPRNSEAQPIGQGAEPAVMVHISVANRTYRVPTKSIGLEITDQALQASTLDLVNLAMTAQARQERVRMVEEQIRGMVQGDADWGEKPITGRKAKDFDSSITQAGQITHKAWIHFLRNDYRKRSLSGLMMDLDTAMAIEARMGKPTVETDDPRSPRIDALFNIDNLGLPRPRILLLDTPVLGANTIVGVDSRYAIRRVINVSAAYSAIEQFVMRRAVGFRVDYGEISHKLYPDAWDVMTLTL